MRILLLVLFIAVTGGCASERTYAVRVQNKAYEPITVGFVKDGPVLEPGWESPEVLSNMPPSRMPHKWGTVVGQDQTRAFKIVGKFDPGTHAFMRVYAGTPTAAEALAKSGSFGDRLDLLLHPNGDNDFVGEEQKGQLSAHLRRYSSP